MKPQTKTLKGFRDFLPPEKKVRENLISALKAIFEKYGFEPLETPSLEYLETLSGKYGAEADRLIYHFPDRGGREVGLRYDLTVPFARVVAEYKNKLAFPFKAYRIAPVWRAENPQRGRYREFYQCDIDTAGAASPSADAEIIAVAYEVFRTLSFSNFIIKFNSRKILFSILEKAGVEKGKTFSAIQAIDKLDKKPMGDVLKELEEKGLGDFSEKIFDEIKKAEMDETLKQIYREALFLGVEKEALKFEPSLSRGLDYYTGAIFEVVVTEPKIGSLAGGGRYDNLIGNFTGRDIPATGISFGLERILDVSKELKMLPSPDDAVSLLISLFPGSESESLRRQSLELSRRLRENNFKTAVYPDPTDLGKQLKYADRKGIPLVVIIGPKEIEQESLTVRNMKDGSETLVKSTAAVEFIKLTLNKINSPL